MKPRYVNEVSGARRSHVGPHLEMFPCMLVIAGLVFAEGQKCVSRSGLGSNRDEAFKCSLRLRKAVLIVEQARQ